MAILILLTDDEAALPAIESAGIDVKVEALSFPAARIREIAPFAVAVDASRDPGQAFEALSALRSEAGGIPTIVVAAESAIDEHPWHEVADDLLDPNAPSAEAALRLAMLRRRAGGAEEAELRLGPLTMNSQTYRVAVDGRPLDLTYKEFELIRFLSTRPGVVFSREALLREVWGYDFYGGTRTVDVHVRRLRAKLGPAHEHLIETVRGVGYRAADIFV
ncbi:MAG: response regulator transcription factor [Actinomycetota bacterium]